MLTVLSFLLINHWLITSGTVVGGLRCPAVLVHERYTNVRFAGGGQRWAAVTVDEKFLLVSLHLPHKGLDIFEFNACLKELRDFLGSFAQYILLIGMDANTTVQSSIDHIHIGHHVPCRAHSDLDSERACLLHEFLCENGLYLVNTFAGEAENCVRALIGMKAVELKLTFLRSHYPWLVAKRMLIGVWSLLPTIVLSEG